MKSALSSPSWLLGSVILHLILVAPKRLSSANHDIHCMQAQLVSARDFVCRTCSSCSLSGATPVVTGSPAETHSLVWRLVPLGVAALCVVALELYVHFCRDISWQQRQAYQA